MHDAPLLYTIAIEYTVLEYSSLVLQLRSARDGRRQHSRVGLNVWASIKS